MQRHLQPRALFPVLSVEEEAIAIDQQTATLADLQAESAVMERLVDTDTVANNVVTVVSAIELPNQIDQALVASVADMTAAGTDTNPDDVLPSDLIEGLSTESFLNSIKEKVKKIWEAVKAAIQKFWEKIKEFFSNILAFFGGANKRTQQLRDLLNKYKKGIDALAEARSYWGKKDWMRDMEQRAKHGSDTADDGGVVLSLSVWKEDGRSSAQFLTIDGVVPTSYPEAIADLYQMAWTLVDKVPALVSVVEKDINTSLDLLSNHSEEKDRVLERFGNRSRRALENLVRELKLNEYEAKNSPTRYSRHMLGNVVVQGHLVFTQNDNLDLMLDDLSQVDLRATVLASKPTKQMPVINLITGVPAIEKIMTTISTWLDQELPKINKAIEQASEENKQFFSRAEGAISHIKDDMDEATVKSIKILVGISARLTSMIGKSIPAYLQECHKVTTAVLDYATQSFVALLFQEEKAGNSESEKGSSVLSTNLKKFIAEGDLDTIRKALQIETEDKKNTKPQLLAMAAEVEKQVSGLWEAYQEKAFARAVNPDQTAWDRKYLSEQYDYLDTNFSKKRFEHILDVLEYLKNN